MRLMVPYQIAYSPLSAIITLYILELHGSVIDVAYALTLSQLVIIPSSIFWGEIVEKYHRRRILINLSFLGLAVSLVGLYFSSTILEVILLYGFLSFIVTANVTPFNLLIMENEPKGRWAAEFSRLQMFSGLGTIVSLAIASVLAYAVNIRILILALAPFALLAMVFTVSLIEPKTLRLKRGMITTLRAFRTRLFSHHLYLLHMRNRSFARRLGYGAGVAKAGYFKMLLIAVFVYYLATYLFNTPYPAGLKAGGLSNFQIFLIILIANTASTAVFFSLGVFSLKLKRARAIEEALLTRGSGYILMAVSFVLLTGTALAGLNAIVYMITSGVAYALFYTSMNTIVFSAIGSRNKSYRLGVYSGVTGLGGLVGSFLSGYLSFYVGYWFTFALAGLLIILCAYIFIRASRIRNEGLKTSWTARTE